MQIAKGWAMPATITKGGEGNSVEFKLRIWYVEGKEEIHLNLGDGGENFSTVTNNPDSARGNPHLYAKLARILAEAKAPHPDLSKLKR